MNINGVSGAGIQPNPAAMKTGGQDDPVSKDLQNQIEKLRNDLKELSANQDMPTEVKMKKRQEIQKEISNLEIQLRQRQMEVKREERQKKQEESSFDELTGTKAQEKQGGSQNTGMSAGSMEAMISADKAVKQADVQGSTAKKMESRANVLEVEIKLDNGRDGSSNTGLKQAELADANEAAQKATASQMDSLAQAGKTMREASKEDSAARKKEDGETLFDKDDKKKSGEEDERTPDTEALEEAGFAYHPVDVRL